MLEVNIKKENESNRAVEPGQIRYSDQGLFVLIVQGDAGYERFDAIILAGATHIPTFSWNSKNQSDSVIADVYPYVAKGKLEITK